MKKPDFVFWVKQIMLGLGTVLFFLCAVCALPASASAIESVFFVPEKIITGTVTDADGEPLIGASVAIEGGTTGVITDIDGNFSIEAEEGDVLVISYLGYADQRVTVGSDNSVSVVMAGDATLLSEIVVEGIRGSEMRSVQMKREATSVIEAITPQQLGNFSDENMADALQRVPGLQVQRDNQGNGGGSRVSIRGVGPEFVNVTVNGRTILSSGNEGFENLRLFNVDAMPPEVLSGAIVYKSSEANLVEPGLGGLIDFQTIRPLDVSYKNDRNFFGAVNVRGEWDEQTTDDVLDLQPRISGLLGGKTDDGKLGGYVSFLTSQSRRTNDFSFIRRGAANFRDVRIDQNRDGVFSETDGDLLIEDVWAPNNPVSVPLTYDIDRIAVNGGLQFKPAKNLDINVDYSFVGYTRDTRRNLTRTVLGPDAINNGVFQPEDVIVEDGVLRYLNTANAFDRRGRAFNPVRMRNTFQVYDEEDENQFGGINVKYDLGNWSFIADYSLSSLEFNQEFRVTGNRDTRLPSGVTYDLRGEIPIYSANNVSEYNNPDPSTVRVLNTFNGWFRRNDSENSAFRFDVVRKLNETFDVMVGYRYNNNDIAFRQFNNDPSLRLNNGESPDWFDSEQFLQDYVNLPGNNDENFFEGVNIGNTHLSPSIFDWGLFQQRFGSRVNSSPTDQMFEGDIFDVDDSEQYQYNRGETFNVEEITNSFYTQLNFKDISLGAVTSLSGNVGLRAVQTEVTGRAFASARTTDPDDPDFVGLNIANAPAVAESDRWDYTPSLNLNFDFNDKFTYRASFVRTISRPDIQALAPRNDIQAVVLSSTSFGTQPGMVDGANLDLKPYSTWQMDHTFEWYNNFGGAIVASVFNKWISDFIIRETVTGVTFDELNFGLEGLPEDITSPDQTYNVTRPINLDETTTVFGFELGFVQPLSVISESLDGFGVRANYTYVTAEFDDVVGNTGGAFPGSSQNNFTSVAYYENERFGVRLAYTYRDDFLRSVGGGNDVLAAPIFTEAYGQLNARVNYNFLDGFQLSLAAENLTGEDRRNFYDNDPSQFARIFTTGQVWTIGLRYGF